MFGFSTTNIFIYFLYPVILISISIFVVSRNREVTVESYFFSNRNTHWLISGMSLITASFFSPYILGFSSAGSNVGLTLFYSVISCVMLIVMGWVVMPRYKKWNINTLPEYFEQQFGRSCKFYLSALYVLSNIVLRLLPVLAIGGAFLNEIVGVDSYSILLFFLMVTALYVLIGGLEAESYVNIIQVLLISLGAGIFSWWMFQQTNDVYSINNNLSEAFASPEFSLVGLLLGLPIIGFWFWTADQFVVQKMLSVKSASFVKKTALATIGLQILPLLIFVLPGIFLYSAAANGSAFVSFHNIFLGTSLSESLRGGIVIGVIAALMATFANVFNSTALLITFDFYRSIKKNASNRELVLIGRMVTIILLLIAILLIPFALTIKFETCITLFKVFAYCSSMVASLFLAGGINFKPNAGSVIVTFCAGTALIIGKAIVELRLHTIAIDYIVARWFIQTGFLEFSIFIFLFSMVFLLVVHKIWVAANSGIISKRHKTVF